MCFVCGMLFVVCGVLLLVLLCCCDVALLLLFRRAAAFVVFVGWSVRFFCRGLLVV